MNSHSSPLAAPAGCPTRALPPDYCDACLRVESPSPFRGREIVASDEEWTLMYEDGAGRWHELGRQTRSFSRKFALEMKADSESRYPEDKYRLAIRTTIIAWPTESDEEDA